MPPRCSLGGQPDVRVRVDQWCAVRADARQVQGRELVVAASGAPVPLARPITRCCSCSAARSHGSMRMRIRRDTR